MKAIIKKLLEIGAKSTNVKTSLKKLPVQDRKKWEGKESFLVKDLWEIERSKRIKDRKKHDSKQAKIHNLSVREYKFLREKAEKILSDFQTGHSMGCYRRLYLNGKSFATNHILDDYARSCKYSPTYGTITINLNKKELLEIQETGHLWTIKGKEVAPKIFECKVLVKKGEKQYFNIEWKNMLLTSNFHAKTVEGAKGWRKIRASQLRVQRKREIEKGKLKNRFVGFRHSMKAGNCQLGTSAFCRRHNLNPNFGYRLDYILSLENSEFTNKLFNVL